MNTQKKTKYCCLCGREITNWGNNPWPVNLHPNARCCDECNYQVILPQRIKDMYMKGKNNERNT